MRAAVDIPRFRVIDDVIETLRPDYPIHCIRPTALTYAAKQFVTGFPGDTLYAVKCNAHPIILSKLHAAGIRHYDVASDQEISLVQKYCPGADLYYHHPAKTAASIRSAYDNAQIRHFAVDCREELDKVIANTGPRGAITVRMAVPQDMSVYDLSTKFGAGPALARALIMAVAAEGRTVGVTFHVGSQCLDPAAYERAMRLAADAARDAGVSLAFMDIGGGFPGYYQTTVAPPLAVYFERIRATADEVCKPTGTRVLCEPGRALVYGSSSLLTQVILRKDSIVYLNDGIFGGFSEVYWGGEALTLTCRAFRPGGTIASDLNPFTVYGPTCDGNDRLPYQVSLPVDVRDGDWLEFDSLGAYGREMATTYNGLRSEEVVVIDGPVASRRSVAAAAY